MISPRSRASEPTAAVRDVLAALDQRTAELQSRKGAVVDEILELEARTVTRTATHTTQKSSTPRSDVATYLDRDEIVAAPDASAERRLTELYAERALIDEAVTLAQQRGFRVRVSNETELAGDIKTRWHKNLFASVMATVELRELAEERARLRNEYASRTGLSLGSPSATAADSFIGPPGWATKATAFLDAARRENIDTE
jgi:hypothetical protein